MRDERGETMSEKLEFARDYKELKVYQLAFESAMQIYELSRKWPPEEKYSLTDQIRRASRSVNGNIAEAWRKRRYEGAFISKLSDAEGEAAETQVWIEFAVKSGYMTREEGVPLYRSYDRIIGTIVGMINHPETWIIKK